MGQDVSEGISKDLGILYFAEGWHSTQQVNGQTYCSQNTPHVIAIFRIWSDSKMKSFDSCIWILFTFPCHYISKFNYDWIYILYFHLPTQNCWINRTRCWQKEGTPEEDFNKRFLVYMFHCVLSYCIIITKVYQYNNTTIVTYNHLNISHSKVDRLRTKLLGTDRQSFKKNWN